QYGEQGRYGLADETDRVTEGQATNIEVHFTNVSAAAGIASSGEAACIIDVDNDGLPDVFIGDSVYRNRGGRSPRFERVATLQPARACAAGDYDNDDFADLFIATSSGGVLYHNNKGRFIQADIVATGTASAVAFIDLDHDGW